LTAAEAGVERMSSTDSQGSDNRLAIVLRGELPSRADLLKRLGVPATHERRRGERVEPGRMQGFDIWVLNLVEWEDFPGWDDARNGEQLFSSAVAWLEKLKSGLAGLDRTTLDAELLFVTMRRNPAEGRFHLPAALLAAAANAGLRLTLSVIPPQAGPQLERDRF
jgi:hypothetical protein